MQDISEIARRLGESEPKAPAPCAHRRIVGVPAESSADELLLKMLRITLAQRASAMTCIRAADRATVVSAAFEQKPEILCVAALPPNGNANARYLCRRLRAQAPDAYIVVLLPEAPDQRSPEAAARLREAGANAVAYDVRETARLLLEKR